MRVVPDCVTITPCQADAILESARSGPPVLIYGRLAEGSSLADTLGEYENVCFAADGIDEFAKCFDRMYGSVSVAECSDRRIGMNRYDSKDGTFVHLIN